MGKKYIGQVDNKNFIYPNNDLFEYDTEIIHDLKNNSVQGQITNVTAVFISGNTGINFQFDYTWDRNGADPYLLQDGNLSILSMHLMNPNQKYFKPWICVGNISNSNVNSTTLSGHANINFSNQGVVLPQGLYYIEFRFIGSRAIDAQEMSMTINYPPLPTPTPSPTPVITDCQIIGTAVKQ